VSAEGARLRRAAALGTVTGARTFLAPAALSLRGRLGTAAKFVVPALAAGELVGDKLPSAPPRIQGPGLVGRLASGAFSGRVAGGDLRGAAIGATFALASAYPSQLLRTQIVAHTPLPDIACAVPEDLLAITLATWASHPPADGPKTPDMLEFSAHRPGAPRSFVSAAGSGCAAALVGGAAMATAREWLRGLGVDDGTGVRLGLLAVGGLAGAAAYDAFSA
jgi:uncharacterized membrane protein